MTTATPPQEFSLATHNGTVTVTNPETKGHRTFQIKTQKPDAKFAPGMRVVSLLIGPDNSNDYKGFGFVADDGVIRLWNKAKTVTYTKLTMILMWPNDYPNLEYLYSGTCRVCNRKLTTPKSIKSGIGPICGGR